MLGFRVGAPRDLPSGWALNHGAVWDYPPHYLGGPNTAVMRVYYRTWTPRGAPLSVAVRLLSLRERAALPNDLALVGSHRYTLRNGTPVYGSLSSGSSLIEWEQHGVWYSIQAFDVAPSKVLGIASSLT